MPADASPRLSRRAVLGIADLSTVHVSSLVVRADPRRMAAVERRIARLKVAEVALSDPSGKIVVVLETADEAEIVAAMGAIERMEGVVSAVLVYHQTEVGGAEP
jgi:nitrate reductase NapD